MPTKRRNWTAKAITRFRLYNRMTQANFAKAAGVSRQMVNMWEHGRKKPGFESLDKLDSLAREWKYPEGNR